MTHAISVAIVGFVAILTARVMAWPAQAEVNSRGTFDTDDIHVQSYKVGLQENSYSTQSEFAPPERCDVMYGKTCYVVIMNMGRIGLGEANEACRRIGGKLANVYSEEHFHLIRSLIRTRTPIGYDYNHVWTGMTVDTQQRRLRLSDGNWAPFVIWHPNRPFTEARPYAGFHVHLDNKSNRQGFFDEWASYRLLGCVCELHK